MTKKKVCIIDDDRIYRYTVKHFLTQHFSQDEILEYENGEDALVSLSEQLESGNELPEVIMVDINMPIVDGWEFLEKFWSKVQHLVQLPKLYLISSSNSISTVDRASRLSYLQGYLTKPLNKEDYLKLVTA